MSKYAPYNWREKPISRQKVMVLPRCQGLPTTRTAAPSRLGLPALPSAVHDPGLFTAHAGLNAKLLLRHSPRQNAFQRKRSRPVDSPHFSITPNSSSLPSLRAGRHANILKISGPVRRVLLAETGNREGIAGKSDGIVANHPGATLRTLRQRPGIIGKFRAKKRFFRDLRDLKAASRPPLLS